MKNVALGVQSYCFREFKDNAVVAGMVRDIGLAAIEVCGVQVDFSKPATFAQVIAAYRDKGVRIVSTGVNAISGNEGQDRPMFEFLKQCGANYMSVDFGLENLGRQLAMAQKLADEFDVKLGIHVHGGRHWLGNSTALRWVFGQTNARIGLNLDTAWALDAGENPVGMMREFKDRLYLLHLKDFTFDRSRTHTDVVVGTGNIDLDAVRQTLGEIGFNGVAIIEYEGDAADPVPALKKCVGAITGKIPFGR